MHRGYIKKWRKILDSPLWINSTPQQKVILDTILLSANHQENKWEWNGQEFKVKPGEFVTSLNSLTEKCGKGVTKQHVRTALKRFEKLKFLTQKLTQYGRVISILNWDIYQQPDKKANTDINTRLTHTSHTPNTRLTPNKNVRMKECKNVKNIYPANFLKFWEVYPKKVGKGAAVKQYKNIKEPKPSLQIILDAVEKQKRTQQWQDKQYIPLPATWLSQRRWEDEIDVLDKDKDLTPEQIKEKYGVC